MHTYMSTEQHEAATLILENRIGGVPKYLIGPAGTGKTMVIDEVLYQVHSGHRENCPGSALYCNLFSFSTI